MKSNFLLLLVFAVFLAACGGTAGEPVSEPTAETAALTSIHLPMGFIPDPQFAPVYVAAEKGYFAEAGFDVEFDYSFETDGIALVGAGQLPFALVSGEQVLLARAQGLPVVYVMEWYQRFPISIVSKADAGINTPADLAGRTIGLPGFFGASYVGYAGFLQANGLSEADVNTEEIGFTQVESLLAGQVEAVVSYVNNEPVQLAAQGVAINELQVADYIDLVANGLITNERMIAENPQMVEEFVRAMLRGVADTLADPDEAFEISKGYIEGLEDGRRAVLDASLPLWEADTLGFTDAASWQQTQDVLLQMGFLDAPVDNLEAAYTNAFVQTAQP